MPRDYPLERTRDIGIIAHIGASLAFARSLKPSGFSISAAGKLPFSRPLSPVNVHFHESKA